MPVEVLRVDAILFDMDGTLIDSTPGVFKAWETFSRDYNLGDSKAVAHATHGRRLYDTLKEYCKINEEDRLQAEIDRFEQEVIDGGPIVLPGVHLLLGQLQSSPETAHRWTIVTSASNKYTPRALEACGVPLPPAGCVTANDVSRGKPQPDPYLAGAKTVGVLGERCMRDLISSARGVEYILLIAHCVFSHIAFYQRVGLVVEDAPSGLRAGKAAGAKTLAVCTSHTREALMTELVKKGNSMGEGVEVDYVVEDLTRVSVCWVDGQLEVSIDETK